MDGRTKRSVASGSSAVGGAEGISAPVRNSSKIEWSAPASHGSLMDTASSPGKARFTAEYSVSTSGARCCIDVIQWAGLLVMICSPATRSYQALWRMPWCPG